MVFDFTSAGTSLNCAASSPASVYAGHVNPSAQVSDFAFGSILKKATQQELTRFATARSRASARPVAFDDQLEWSIESNANISSAECTAPLRHSVRNAGT